MEHRLDLICMGRAAVDLYGEQIGSPLEQMQTFAKYLGGCAANIAVGAARQGLRVAMLSRVGDEHMGRFVRETLAAEGVDTTHLVTDPRRLTALVLLAIRNRDSFPLIFYRENCADMGLDRGDVEPAFIASSRALLVTGTHFSTPGVDAASRAAMAAAREAGTRVALDIDYRPVLWGLTGHGLGEERFVADERVSAHLQSIVPGCDLVVGTEEEIHIAGGSTDTLTALRRLRALTPAALVVKRGPRGCVVFDGEIPGRLEDGIVGRGFQVDLLNVLGAGDAFMAGFLRGWVAGEPLERCATYANAAGALVVSRHGCAPAMPSRAELDDFIERAAGIVHVSEDRRLDDLHRDITRGNGVELCIFAFDNRLYLEQLAAEAGVELSRLERLKRLLARAAERGARAARLGTFGGHAGAGVAGAQVQAGVIIDDRWGLEALFEVTDSGFWVARAVERSGLVPLTFEHGVNVGLTLRTWPREHVAKCLVRYHPEDEPSLREEHLTRIEQLYRACVTTEHELLLEVLPPEGAPVDGETLPLAMAQIYERGVRPDWWKLKPQAGPEPWRRVSRVIERYDPHCRGVVVLGGGLSLEELAAGFRATAGISRCKGFAVGRTIFAEPCERWLAGGIDDEELMDRVATRFARVVELWRRRAGEPGGEEAS